MDFQSNRFYHIISYGCQANMSDSEHYAGQLEELGYHHTGGFGYSRCHPHQYVLCP